MDNCSALLHEHPINMDTKKAEILISDVIPKPARAEEPAVPRSEMKTKLPSALRVIAILLIVVALAAICLGQNSPSAARSTAPSTAKTDATRPVPFLTPLPQDTGLPGLKQQLGKLQTTGRLMMVVAHPDDEDGGTLTLEARGKGVQTLLFTLTRGEGGQNELGTGLFDKLGILRTLELLASDKYYGVEQRFSRVADFGYSKTAEETFQKWGGHDVPLSDMVRVIRTFRPDVLVARFSGTDADGHGHHQASAILTREAFRAAADPNRFPEQIKEGLQPWQPKKLYIGNVCGFRSNTCDDENWTVKLDAGEVDPVLGMSYAQMAADGLAHQRSQGHGEYKVTPGAHNSFYKLVDSVLPNTKDTVGHEKNFFDGIDTKPPAFVNDLVKKAQEAIETGALDDAVQPLFDLSEKLTIKVLFSTSRTEGPLRSLSRDSQKALHMSLGVSSAASASDVAGGNTPNTLPLSPISPGQKFEIYLQVHNGSYHPINPEDLFVEPGSGFFAGPRRSLTDVPPATIAPGQNRSSDFPWRLPTDFTDSRPYWHRSDPETQSINSIDNERYATLPFAPDPLSLRFNYTISKRGIPANLLRDVVVPVRAWAKDDQGSTSLQTLAIVPPFSVALEPGEQVLPVADGKETTVKVGVSSNLAGAPAGTLHLDLPAGWRAEPDSLKVSSTKRGDQQDFTFKVFPANLKEGRSEIRAVLDASGTKYAEGYTLVTREDLGSAYYFQPAVQHVSIVDVKIPKGLKVGYILGAGDDIPTVLQQIGMDVTIIPAEKIATENLSQYGTIVLGVRAYDAQKDVVANSQKLLDYVFNGGTLVVQHNNDTGAFNSAHFTPYPATLGRTRVSVEEAPVTILAPENSVFHYPNEISQKDFDGWVQERGLYFMDKWDDHFTPLMSCHDPNEPDAKGGLLYAKYGKGIYIYSGYAFYRQLPAGVSGAIRLFVNMVSAGSAASSY
jgi:LmbE family N-acetylglucosaminyl deacetylase